MQQNSRAQETERVRARARSGPRSQSRGIWAGTEVAYIGGSRQFVYRHGSTCQFCHVVPDLLTNLAGIFVQTAVGRVLRVVRGLR